MAGSGDKSKGTVSVFDELYRGLCGNSIGIGDISAANDTIFSGTNTGGYVEATSTGVVASTSTDITEKLEQQEATIKQLLLTQADLLNAIHDLKLRVEELEGARPIEYVGSHKGGLK